VASYTIYLIDLSGRMRLGDSFQRAGDAEAIAEFRRVERGGDAAELWRGGVLVARLDATGEFTAGGG